MADGQENKPLTDTARAVGSAIGKAVSAVRGGATPTRPKENLWAAEYQGSGTFIIHKPKRRAGKRHQMVVRNRRRGMRK